MSLLLASPILNRAKRSAALCFATAFSPAMSRWATSFAFIFRRRDPSSLGLQCWTNNSGVAPVLLSSPLCPRTPSRAAPQKMDGLAVGPADGAPMLFRTSLRWCTLLQNRWRALSFGTSRLFPYAQGVKMREQSCQNKELASGGFMIMRVLLHDRKVRLSQ